MEVIEDSRDKLVVRYRATYTEFNAGAGVVTQAGKIVAHFDKIRSIQISSKIEESEESWLIKLRVGWIATCFIGSTTEQVDASIIAARIATITKKKVIA